VLIDPLMQLGYPDSEDSSIQSNSPFRRLSTQTQQAMAALCALVEMAFGEKTVQIIRV
jgi:hypothetical protein